LGVASCLDYPRHRGAYLDVRSVWHTTAGASAGFGLGSSQSGMARLSPEQYFLSSWSSGNLYGLEKVPSVRGFFCRVNADLVLHGATEPKAAVTIQGERVAVRKDGTFSVRLALPEGAQSIEIDVTSADGRKTKTLLPVVTLAWAGAPQPGTGARAPFTPPSRGAS